MARDIFALFVTIATFAMSGCATKIMTFKTAGKAQVSIVSPGKLDEDGTVLGTTPLSVGLDKLTGKVVKLTQDGKQPVYWVVAEAAGDTTVANIKMPDDPSAAQPGAEGAKLDTKASTNRVLRLLMRAYQALSGKRFKVARDLADQAAAIDPELAAPQVIKGLSFYQEGNAGEAKAALTKAQALDPEDQGIGTLLKVIR